MWQTHKLAKAAHHFKNCKVPCGQCGGLLSTDGLIPLSLMRCGRCGYMNVIPMQLADFWLYQPLGGGGSGSVYLAYWPRKKMRCAVKVLRGGEQSYDKAATTLKREAEVLGFIGNHPCIVRLISSGISNDECFMAMDYIEGERLDNRIARLTMMPEKEALRTLVYLLAAEKYIYRRGYLYADIKPENIIITRNNIPVMIDFGLCMTVDEAGRRKKGFVGGSPYYLPPERIQKDAEGPHSEIYSLGMLMFTALTGNTFFKFAGDVQDLAMKHIQTARLTVTQAMMPQSSPCVVELVEQMIRRNPIDRFQTFEEVEAAAMHCLRRTKGRR
jgi:serine/threonine protein kinase